jgi:carbamoyltransferase
VSYILGISAFYHDSAAALLRDGEIVAAVQEERFSRVKYDESFPARAIDHCLSEAGIRADRLDYVAFYEQPLTKFERLLETYVGYAPEGFASFRKAMPVWLRRKLHLPAVIRRGLGTYSGPILFPSHHESHAASAFFPSPFDEAAILTLDGAGEWSTTTIGHGRGHRLRLLAEMQFPHSLGLLYTAFTYYCGFKVNSGEYKLMGLAPYGTPRFVDTILSHLVDVKPDGSFHMDLSYFDYCQGLTMTSEKFHARFGGPPRKPDSPIDQRHMDLAASIQRVCEEIMMRAARHAWERTGKPRHLVLAGGVALNCVANGRLLREGPFEDIWVQPASGDAGGALGAALFVWHQLLEKPRVASGVDRQRASLLGPSYSEAEIEAVLDEVGARYVRVADEPELLRRVAQAMAAGKIVGWFHGRAEFGPRALGARSIIADARNAATQSALNVKIKFRESFRPFAPCVLREHVHEWFAMRPGQESPYMLLVAPVLDGRRTPLSPEERRILREDPDLAKRVNVVRSSVPAITHVDYSARVQTVDERHGRFYRLLKAFREQTGCDVIVNTSFNLSWEPIVLTPREAYHTFMQSDMDVLVLESFLLERREQQLGLELWGTEHPESEPAESETVLVGSGAAHPRRTTHASRPRLRDVERDATTSPWADPLTGHPLVITPRGALNPVTGARYAVDDGIPRLFVPTDPSTGAGADVTEIVQQFYEKTPFPSYDDVDTPRALLEKARGGLFARLLNEQIPYGARVVEIGCGTGQLTNFLAIAHRTVIGVDLCLNSLRLAQGFKVQHGLDRATFAQMNLFRPALRDGFFDFVISNGVLHHTSDCRQAFRRIARLARPGGYVIVGLYSRFSRKIHYARRAVSRWTGLSPRWMDPHFDAMMARGKTEAWLQDQYRHPHETCHTMDEVLGWMAEDGLEFVNSIPKPTPGPVLTPGEALFATRSAGTAIGRFLSQVADFGSGYREGGFFTMIGRRSGGHR